MPLEGTLNGCPWTYTAVYHINWTVFQSKFAEWMVDQGAGFHKSTKTAKIIFLHVQTIFLGNQFVATDKASVKKSLQTNDELYKLATNKTTWQDAHTKKEHSIFLLQ